MFGQATLPPRTSLDPLSTVWEGYQASDVLDAADWLLGDAPAAPMPGARQLPPAPRACTARAPSAPLPVLEAAPPRPSIDGSHLSRRSSAKTEGVESWLAGWGKLAEEQGCAASPLETSSMQALLQRMSSQPLRRAHSSHSQEAAPTRRPTARTSCDFGAGVALQPPRPPLQQWPEGVACYQQYSAPQPALSDGGSNSAGQGRSGDSSFHRNSEEMYSGYSRALGSASQQQGSPCRCCGRSQQPSTQLPPPHPALPHGAQQLQQQYGAAQATCHRRQSRSIDLGARPFAPRGRSSMDACGERGAAAVAQADALASLAVRTHKRKSEEVLQPPPASHARLPASTTNWRTAMGSSFYSSAAAPQPQPQPQPQAQPQQMFKRAHSGAEPGFDTTSAAHTRATTPAVFPGYGVATPPLARGCSFDRQRGSPTSAHDAPAGMQRAQELECGSFLQAMQEVAAAAPLLTQPFHQQQLQQGQQPAARPAPASPCVFSMLDWNEMLPDELLGP